MSSYDRAAVELLVPTIWDRSYAWGMVDEFKPDPSMPKSRAAKNQGNTLWACLADIRRAWDRAPLTFGQSQALLLVGGMGMTYRLAGAFLGTSKSTVQRGYESGVSVLLDWINGAECASGTDDDEEENDAQ